MQLLPYYYIHSNPSQAQMQPPPIHLFGCTVPLPHPHSQLLALISAHPAYKSRVNQFLLLLGHDLKAENLVKLGALVYAAMVPEMPPQIRRRLAVEMCQAVQMHQPDRVTYTNLSEFLLRLCDDFVENVDVRSAVGLLDLLEARIADYYVVDARDQATRRKLQANIKLELFDSENVINDADLPEKFHRRASELVYFEQKLQLQEDLEISPYEVIVKKLKEKPEQVIPLGFVHEQFCFDYINNNFETKNSYRLKPNKNIRVPDKVEYWVSINSAAGNLLRDKVVNQQIYHNCPVLSLSHLPDNIVPAPARLINLYRFNQVFSRVSYYEKLKQNAAPSMAGVVSNKWFNILSEFYDRDEFNIDELSLTKERFIVKRKEQALGIQGKEVISKEQKDYEDEARLLAERVSRSRMQNHIEKREEENIKDLAKSLRPHLQQDKNINVFLQKHLSAEQTLPNDNADPFKQDIITLAKKDPLQILILGRAKSGKSTLAKALAAEYNLFHISVETIINKVIERSNFFRENPPEADEDGNIKGGLLKIEECVLEDLENGRKVQEEDLLDLVNVELKREVTQSRGYILDLPLEYSNFWYEAIVSNKVWVPKIGCRFFNRVIEISQTEAEWAYFTKGIFTKPDDLTLSSSLDRYLRTKPKPPPEQGQQQAQQQEKPAPLIESNLLRLVWQNSLLPLVEHITNHINPIHYLKVHNAYQSVPECLNSLQQSLYRIPLPKKIQGNQKQLLTVGLEERKLARKWSPWGLVDPIELHKERNVNGKYQFAAEYAGRVFVFENEANLNLFIDNPRPYLQVLPKLPKKTNIFLAGPRKSGKKTLAKLLSTIYGLKIVNFQQLLKNVIRKQKQSQNHIPSNPDKTSKAVHLSQPELKQFMKGGLLNAKDILPIVLYQLGVPLQKKPVGWGIEKTQEEQAQQQQQEEKKAPPKKTKKKEKNQEQRPKTPVLEDLPLKEIIPAINHKGKLDQIKGYIFIGYPHNQQQLNALKAFNIPVDKYILLSDNSEQNPYKTLSKRLSDSQLEQVANLLNNIGPVKQALGQQVFKEITNLQLTPDEIVNKVRQFIDPFYEKCDEDSINRVLADRQEDGDPIPLGFCGDYCPVSLASKWLIKGKEEFETGFQGRRFKFVGQAEMNSFKENPGKYINKENLLIPPRIMFMGIRGVGLKTQLLKLNQKYKIPILNFKQTLLQQLQNEKHKRKTQRYFSKGFKAPQYDQQGRPIQDPELNQQAADFDRAALQIQVTKRFLTGINEIFINGNYYDVEQEAVQTQFVDLLFNARRLPEAVFILRSDEGKWLQRNLDRKKIEQELEQMTQKKREEKQRQREEAIAEARQRAQDAGEQYQQPEEAGQQQLDVPKLEQLIAQRQQALKAQREADNSKLDQLAEAFKSWNVDVIEVKCEREAKHVTDRINFAIGPYIEDRLNRWQQNSMLPIERHRARDFLNDYIALESRFGPLNPFTLMRPVLSYPLIYNDRIYYLNDQQEREKVMRNPQLLQTNVAVPHDVRIIPSAAVVGLPKTGKTTLVDALSKRLGLVKISMADIVEEFSIEHTDCRVRQILDELRKGQVLTNEMAVDLIERRVSMSDCQNYGWVLDSFPVNREQCELLNKKGLLPQNVFSLKLSDIDIKKRVIARNMKNPKLDQYDYDYDMEIIHERLNQNRNNILEVEVYFQTKFNNLDILDAKISKWGLFEQVKNTIQRKNKCRKDFVRSLVTHTATAASNIGLNFNCILNNLSQFGNYCPISYKIRREYIKVCLKHHRHVAMYNKKIYLFASGKQLNDFVSNPQNYRNKGPSFNPPQQVLHNQIHTISGKAQNKGFCFVQLSRKKLVKGCPEFTLHYKGKYYSTSSAANMKLFIRNPALFEMVKLQDKLPVQLEKKADLKKLARQNDCTAFLQHHLSNIMMKSLAQLGYRRPKFPTIGSKESALKFLSISLKAYNPNKDDEYRQKYLEKLDKFIKQCSYSQQIREELDRKARGQWGPHDEENLLKLCEEYHAFLSQVNSVDKSKYFTQFIR